MQLVTHLCNGQLPSYFLKINISVQRPAQRTRELRPIAITGEAAEGGTCKIQTDFEVFWLNEYMQHLAEI
jgi:hypothetical protein